MEAGVNDYLIMQQHSVFGTQRTLRRHKGHKVWRSVLCGSSCALCEPVAEVKLKLSGSKKNTLTN